MKTDTDAIRVLIADDHAVVREGVRHVLDADHGFQVVGEAATGADVVRLARSLDPDVIVLDISMPEMTGLQALDAIREARPEARVLMLSIHENQEYTARSARAGARGYLRKDSAPSELREAVRAIHAGATYFCAPTSPPSVAGPSATPEPGAGLASLSAREREVLAEIAHGASNKEIAARLRISVRTVESHRDSVMRKLELKGTAALTRFAIEHKLV